MKLDPTTLLFGEEEKRAMVSAYQAFSHLKAEVIRGGDSPEEFRDFLLESFRDWFFADLLWQKVC
jgi:hypothetical protein